jgi:hypothetical protein
MGTTRHFHVVFDVRVLNLNLSNDHIPIDPVDELKVTELFSEI